MTTARDNWTARQRSAYFGARNPHAQTVSFWPAGTPHASLGTVPPQRTDVDATVAIRTGATSADPDERTLRRADVVLSKAHLPTLPDGAELGDLGVILDADGNYWRLIHTLSENAALWRLEAESVSVIRLGTVQAKA